MPRKPKFIHPVRQVRTCLGHTQPAFAKLVGCSAIAIERIENGRLGLSLKLAHAISEATGADAASLRAGKDAKALDGEGKEYSKEALKFYKEVVPCTDQELQHYMRALVRYVQLLLIASNRGGKFKAHAVNTGIQAALEKLADDFDLKKSIEGFLVEKGSAAKRKYRVGDLRKFPRYARLLGFKDKKSYKPERLIEFTIPMGWIQNYQLVESPLLPHGVDRKLRGNAA